MLMSSEIPWQTYLENSIVPAIWAYLCVVRFTHKIHPNTPLTFYSNRVFLMRLKIYEPSTFRCGCFVWKNHSNLKKFTCRKTPPHFFVVVVCLFLWDLGLNSGQTLTKQVFHCLSHTSSLFCSGYFGFALAGFKLSSS
jgi:hypothetical protein